MRGNTGSNLIEFLRFGSSIPGGYWGCCAGDIIQAFKTLPNEPASCQSVNGDSGYPQQNENGQDLFFGMTNEEIFRSRLRVGTFGTGDMPNHFFIVVLTDSQCNGAIGKAWLPIMKECGFEYVRSVNNSVWNVNNHIFMLVRNCGDNARADQFTPPKTWTDLPSIGKKELWELIPDTKALTAEYKAVDAAVWDKLGNAKLYTRDEVVKAGAPVVLAGQRSEYPQEEESIRQAYDATKAPKKVEQSLRSPTPIA